jgi:hypothetical protein
MATHVFSRPLRVGIFSAIDKAEMAVKRLLQAGFTKDDITVVCSNREIEARFREFEHQEPAGYYTPQAVATGAGIGAAVGLMGAIALLAFTRDFGSVAMGCIMVGAGVVVGGLFSAMMTRGAEKELANFYDQAAPPGSILVAAESHLDRPEEKLKQAELVLAEAGAEPMQFDEG